MDFGVSKSGSPAASLMTGTPDSTKAVAASAMAMVLDGFKAATRGLMVVSTEGGGEAPLAPLVLADTVMADNCFTPLCDDLHFPPHSKIKMISPFQQIKYVHITTGSFRGVCVCVCLCSQV